MALETNNLLVYANPIVAGIALIFSIKMMITLSNKQFKESFYKYLEIQALFFILNSFVTILQPIIYCINCEISMSLFTQIYYIGFRIYGSSICEMMALYSNWLSGLNCCLLLCNGKLAKLALKIIVHYKLVTLGAFIFSTVLYCYQFEEFDIFQKEDKTYDVVHTQFKETNAYFIIEVIVEFIRDGVSLIILIGIDFVLLIKMKDIMKNKQHIMNASYNKTIDLNMSSNLEYDLDFKSASDKRQIKLNKIKRRQVITVLMNCSACILGRLPILISFVLRFRDDPRDFIFFCVASLFVQLYYIATFFLLFWFNQRFRRVALTLCFYIFSKEKTSS